MIFDDLVTVVRREIIVDEYTDAFDDARILDALWRASVDIAAAFDFPRGITTAAVAEGDVSITAGVTMRKVHSVIIGGDDCVSSDMPQLLRISPGLSRGARYFNFDPRRADALRIAPPTRAGTATIEYTALLTEPSPLGTAVPWSGVLADFHPLIAYRAAMVLYQMEERTDELQYWTTEYQNRATELAAFLGRTDLGNAMVPADARGDMGASG